jgi:quinol monooxygenase YgiN
MGGLIEQLIDLALRPVDLGGDHLCVRDGRSVARVQIVRVGCSKIRDRLRIDGRARLFAVQCSLIRKQKKVSLLPLGDLVDDHQHVLRASPRVRHERDSHLPYTKLLHVLPDLPAIVVGRKLVRDVLVPPCKDACMELLKGMSADTPKDAGYLRYDVLQQPNRPNHFTVVEAWASPEPIVDHQADRARALAALACSKRLAAS